MHNFDSDWIKRSTDLINVVRELKVPLVKGGADSVVVKCLKCKTDSLKVTHTHYRCGLCSNRGDQIEFVMERKALGFIAACLWMEKRLLRRKTKVV